MQFTYISRSLLIFTSRTKVLSQRYNIERKLKGLFTPICLFVNDPAARKRTIVKSGQTRCICVIHLRQYLAVKRLVNSSFLLGRVLTYEFSVKI